MKKNILSVICGVVMFNCLYLMGYREENQLLFAYAVALTFSLGLQWVFYLSRLNEGEFISLFENEKKKLLEKSGGRAFAEYEKEESGRFFIRIYIEKSSEEEAAFLMRKYKKFFQNVIFDGLISRLMVVNVDSKTEIPEARRIIKEKVKEEM